MKSPLNKITLKGEQILQGDTLLRARLKAQGVNLPKSTNHPTIQSR